MKKHLYGKRRLKAVACVVEIRAMRAERREAKRIDLEKRLTSFVVEVLQKVFMDFSAHFIKMREKLILEGEGTGAPVGILKHGKISVMDSDGNCVYLGEAKNAIIGSPDGWVR